MNLDNALHIVEIIVIGTPIWYGAIRLSILLREFPLHLHEYSREGVPSIRYPRGYEPGHVEEIFGVK